MYTDNSYNWINPPTFYPNYAEDEMTETETIVEVTETEKNGKKKTVTKTTTKTTRTPRRYQNPYNPYPYGRWYSSSQGINTNTIAASDLQGNAKTVAFNSNSADASEY